MRAPTGRATPDRRRHWSGVGIRTPLEPLTLTNWFQLPKEGSPTTLSKLVLGGEDKPNFGLIKVMVRSDVMGLGLWREVVLLVQGRCA